MTGYTVTTSSHSSEPPISNRVIALNSFVLLARKVVSVLLLDRVYALMENIVDQLPALYFFRKIYYTETLMSLYDALGRRFL
jgi:hypothetical protein